MPAEFSRPRSRSRRCSGSIPSKDGLSWTLVRAAACSASPRAASARVSTHSITTRTRSVARRSCKRRHFPGDTRWVVERGSALDEGYLRGLGTFDVVYSWGVLHHTGEMMAGTRTRAATGRTRRPSGDRHLQRCRRPQRQVASGSNAPISPCRRPLRPPFAAIAIAPTELRMACSAVLRGQPLEYVRSWTRYAEQKRGMSRWRDIVDWVGGYPYEYAQTDSIFRFYRQRGFAHADAEVLSGTAWV